MKKVVAITGGIGSGKSEVLRIIKNLDNFVISADDVNRQLLADAEYLDILHTNFPTAFDDNVFIKKKLADIIFNDKEKRLLLNHIAHKRIRELIEETITNARDEIIFVEVPLLIESGMLDMFDDVIVVTADVDIKIDRVSKRDNISREDVLKRMQSQLDDSELIKVATYVIENNSSREILKQKVNDVLNSISNK